MAKRRSSIGGVVAEEGASPDQKQQTNLSPTVAVSPSQDSQPDGLLSREHPASFDGCPALSNLIRNRDIPMAGHTVTNQSPDAAAVQSAIVAAADSDSLASGDGATTAAIEVLPNGEKKFSHLVFKPAVSPEKSEKSSKSNLSEKKLEQRRLEKLALEVESPVPGLH